MVYELINRSLGCSLFLAPVFRARTNFFSQPLLALLFRCMFYFIPLCSKILADLALHKVQQFCNLFVR
jgi:hypothetical protein